MSCILWNDTHTVPSSDASPCYLKLFKSHPTAAGQRLGAMVSFWKSNSARNFLPALAAEDGYGEGQRNRLGAGSGSSSLAYVRTTRAVTMKMQERIFPKICDSVGAFDET